MEGFHYSGGAFKDLLQPEDPLLLLLHLLHFRVLFRRLRLWAGSSCRGRPSWPPPGAGDGPLALL